jgi:DNA integrity scanning protein DisA with diadenylate cyclase activity
MFLPLPENQIKGRKFCTRYRDAIELTKKCDALVFIVSVETGKSSLRSKDTFILCPCS